MIVSDGEAAGGIAGSRERERLGFNREERGRRKADL